jgi:heme exporter protein A
LLRFENLACQRGGHLIFEGLSADVAPGTALMLRGPNGSGKSSLLRLLADLHTPAAGTIIRAADHAFLGHDAALKLSHSVLQELTFWCRLKGDIAQMPAAIDAMGLTALQHLTCRLLSAGQRRRAAIARVLCSGAPLWLLDEPTVGLDSAAQLLLQQALEHHLASGGALVVATHVDLQLSATQQLVLA